VPDQEGQVRGCDEFWVPDSNHNSRRPMAGSSRTSMRAWESARAMCAQLGEVGALRALSPCKNPPGETPFSSSNLDRALPGPNRSFPTARPARGAERKYLRWTKRTSRNRALVGPRKREDCCGESKGWRWKPTLESPQRKKRQAES